MLAPLTLEPVPRLPLLPWPLLWPESEVDVVAAPPSALPVGDPVAQAAHDASTAPSPSIRGPRLMRSD